MDGGVDRPPQPTAGERGRRDARRVDPSASRPCTAPVQAAARPWCRSTPGGQADSVFKPPSSPRVTERPKADVRWICAFCMDGGVNGPPQPAAGERGRRDARRVDRHQGRAAAWTGAEGGLVRSRGAAGSGRCAGVSPSSGRSGRSARRWPRRRTGVAREAKVGQDAPDDPRIVDRCEHTHSAATVWTGQHVHGEHPLEQVGPPPAPRPSISRWLVLRLRGDLCGPGSRGDRRAGSHDRPRGRALTLCPARPGCRSGHCLGCRTSDGFMDVLPAG